MNEAWILGIRDGCLSGPKKQGVYGIIVKNNMSPNVKQWDMRVIRELFNYADAEEILQVPLVEDVKKYIMVWKEEQNGICSVRSGYRLWISLRISHVNGEGMIIGVVSGILNLHLESNILCGEFAGVVY